MHTITLIYLLAFVNFLPTWVKCGLLGRKVGEWGKGGQVGVWTFLKAAWQVVWHHISFLGRPQAWADIPVSPLRICEAWAKFFALPEP